MKVHSGSALCVSICCLFFPVTGSAYQEPGRSGESASWITPEFNSQWGLETIHAQYAYARGYNGQGVNIGILDAKLFQHPEFSSKLTLLSDNLPYDFETDDKSGIITFENHGVHVAGIAAANRDGSGMHGVAFGATLTTGNIPDSNNLLESMTQSNVRVINNSWGDEVPVEKDADGNNLSLPDGTDKYIQLTPDSQINALLPLRESIYAFSQNAIPATIADEEKDIASYAGMLRAARHGKLIVFAAGNENNYNVPTKDATLPYLFPEVLNHYLIVTNLTPDNDLDVTSTGCGHTASYCVSAPGTDIYSATGNFVSLTDGPITEAALNRGELGIEPGYKKETGSSMAAPHVTGAAAVLMQRFPYMTAEQISTVLKTTATDLGNPGIDGRFGWGKINLQEAINGPKMFITPTDIPVEFYVPGSYTSTQFVANVPGIGAVLDAGTPLERQCLGPECGLDIWRNDIAGYGGLTKEGTGTLVMTGTNTYAGPTRVNQGQLTINGSVTSDVSVQGSGIVGGSGTVGSITAHRGGTVAPGNSTGTLNVVGNVNFEPGSRYAVEVGSNGQSDRIQSNGAATIGGGEVVVTLENRKNLLTQSEIRSLSGQKYTILSAQQGVSGQFDMVVPNYLFLGTGLIYQLNGVSLNVGRNDTSFTSVAQTPNERAVATAVDALTMGNPVYESILHSRTVSEARQAFRQLSGQIHADIASALVNSSRYLRETLNGRLRQAEGLASSSAIRADEGGVWAHLLGAWDHATGNASATGYQASTYGVLAGMDSAVDNWRLGGATGYTRTSLSGGYSSKANSDNYHLAVYGDRQFGTLGLRGGVSYTWHRIDTGRSVNYSMQSGYDTAKYSARTGQLFAEAGYSVKADWLNLEPFVNLAYVHFGNNGIEEIGGAEALRGDKQHTNATVSTLGLRADTGWQVNPGTTVALRSEMGWQHQYDNLVRGARLHFTDGNVQFRVNSVPVSRDGMVLKAGAEATVNENIRLSLGYSGMLSHNHQDNSVNANFTWRF
ncbi:autotransporter outer membrane beta-barrel domain-containing protein [Salmonella enterica]|nr:autotransporter outer membrane beta-barrel domain-containing protein [Salmonella enterica]EGL4359878.1 autotransporter outer membrane beta-barrel domain-containing protein [Salmonella enterica]EGL4382877.1 autotransporter outer membrane beta-barrel domain-containing protein [Salmonella enterica]EGL4488154.1 autotransporter outer membrane beta-barrel domain-containing protein [Salmonella enterica]EGL4515363.1 autotransporter outer membrane beta-barrel domain-containing protein [Salmonella ent